ncbi:hypothetical protein [Vitiosangium sp. GDMCC 1.1324]|uniref:hypothetical protein n=1 Tax=Vitiosangium sp. (strain GDMCC 1.1324) TaxID=2138576 RepID=UPI0011B43F6C|nr:hypothetical protein [Vitiosangium sp. GDMCC 1.1324]
MPHSSDVDGALQRPGKSIYFDSDLRDAAQLALWFRSLAPPSEPMVFCDESMSGYLDLAPNTTEADIFRAFDYEPAPPGWMSYDLIPRGGWGMPLQVLAQQMRLRWPAARVEESAEPESRRAFDFQVPMTHSEVRGNVRRKVSAMIFTGDIRDCAELASWCRSILSTEEILLSCDQGHLTLKAGMNAEDILKALGTP